MPALLQRLVASVDGLHYAALTPAAVSAAKRALLDALGCAIAALGCPPARLAAKALPQNPGAVTVIGEAGGYPLESAALLNGILVRYLDMMDVYSANDVCHPAENVPLALAAVEQAGGDGKRLIEAIIAGYEAQMRLAHALSFQGMGMHHVSGAGLVAPMVIGKAWDLSAGVIEQAAALSGVRGFALHALSKGGLSMAKALGYPWAAMDAILAIRLAEQGCTGPVGLLDWLATDGPLKGRVDADALDARNPGLMVERVSFKQFPIQFELQAPVEVALDLHAQIAGAAIERVEVRTRPVTLTRTGDPAKFTPRTRETADHSLPVCVAMALLDGHVTAHQFETDRWAAEDVLGLVKRVIATGDPALDQQYPGGRPARLTVTLGDGRTLEGFAAVPLGDVTRPMDDAALERKFMANATPNLGEQRASQLVNLVYRIDSMDRIDALTALLRRARPAATITTAR